MKPWSDRSQVVCAAVGGAILLVGLYWGLHAERREFQRQVHVGMTAKELIQAVGQPSQELGAGEVLSMWGNSPKRIVKEPTWVYFVFPASQHRFAVTLRDDRVAGVEYAGN